MFDECKNIEEAKSLFRKLCHLLHPDKGGSNDLMILLNHTYEKKINSFSYEKKEEPKFRFANKIMAGDERLNLLDEMFDYIEDYPDIDFNTEFLFAIELFLKNKGYISVKQFEGLQNWFEIWKKKVKGT